MVTMWSAGITRDIASAQTKRCVFYRNYNADITLTASGQPQDAEPLEDLAVFMVGALIRF